MKRNEGAFAVFTLVFFLVVGIGLIMMLWGIGYSTGTYNRLYLSTQQAAYAAVTTRPPEAYQFDSTSAQPELFCDPSPKTNLFRCTGGPTLAAATKVLKTTYPAATQANLYGQTFDNTLGGSVRLVNENFEPECLPGPTGCTGFIYAYELSDVPSRQNQECMKDGSFSSGPNVGGETSTRIKRIAQNFPEGAGASVPTIPESELPVACWQVRERGIAYPPQTETGVVVRTQTSIQVPPGCNPSVPFCPSFTLNALAVATVSQPEAQKEYGKNDDRGPAQTIDTSASNTFAACPVPDSSGAPVAGGILAVYDYTDKKLYLYAFAQNSNSAQFTLDGKNVATTVKRGNGQDVLYQAVVSKNMAVGDTARITFQAFNVRSSSELQRETAKVRSSTTRFGGLSGNGNVRAGLPYCPEGTASPPAPVVDKAFVVDSAPSFAAGTLTVRTTTRNAASVDITVTANGTTRKMTTSFDGDNGGNQAWRSVLAASGNVQIKVTATAANGKTTDYIYNWNTN